MSCRTDGIRDAARDNRAARLREANVLSDASVEFKALALKMVQHLTAIAVRRCDGSFETDDAVANPEPRSPAPRHLPTTMTAVGLTSPVFVAECGPRSS